MHNPCSGRVHQDEESGVPAGFVIVDIRKRRSATTLLTWTVALSHEVDSSRSASQYFVRGPHPTIRGRMVITTANLRSGTGTLYKGWRKVSNFVLLTTTTP